jgi:hypothetical protein
MARSATRRLIVVLVTLAGLALPACTRSSTTCPPHATGPGVSRVDLGGRVSRLAVGNRAIWGVMRPGHGSGRSDVIEIDPSTGRIVGRPVSLSGAVVGLDAGEGAVWAVTFQGLLLRIDPRSHRTLSRFQLPQGVSGLAVGLAGVWVTNADEGTVSRVDPLTGRASATHVQYGPRWVEAGGQAVWVQTQFQKAPLYRIDPSTVRVTNELDAHLEAVSAHAVWVTGAGGRGLHRIDPTTVQPKGPSLGFDSGPVSVGLAGAQVWVGKYFFDCHRNTEGPVAGSFAWFRVDPKTLRALSGPVFVGVGAGPGPFAHPVFSEGSFWIEPAVGRGILRINLKKAGDVAPTPTPGLPSPATTSA